MIFSRSRNLIGISIFSCVKVLQNRLYSYKNNFLWNFDTADSKNDISFDVRQKKTDSFQKTGLPVFHFFLTFYDNSPQKASKQAFLDLHETDADTLKPCAILKKCMRDI